MYWEERVFFLSQHPLVWRKEGGKGRVKAKEVSPFSEGNAFCAFQMTFAENAASPAERFLFWPQSVWNWALTSPRALGCALLGLAIWGICCHLSSWAWQQFFPKVSLNLFCPFHCILFILHTQPLSPLFVIPWMSIPDSHDWKTWGESCASQTQRYRDGKSRVAGFFLHRLRQTVYLLRHLLPAHCTFDHVADAGDELSW